jgi:hypothetical protein
MNKAQQTPLDIMAAVQELPLEHHWVGEAAEIIGSSRKHGGRFTGMKLAKGDPEKYGRIVALRTYGMTVREVARIERVSPQTVTAVMRVEEAGRTAEEYRAGMAADLAVAAKMTAEAILEKLADPEFVESTSGRDLAYMLKEIGEKKELLSGGATHRSETGRTDEELRADAERHAATARELLADGGIVDIGGPPYGETAKGDA